MKPCLTCFVGKRDGRVTTVICMDKGRPSFKKLVTPQICNNCQETGTPLERPQEPHTEPPVITPLGTLIYPRTGWEAPPVAPGYHRRSSDLTSDDAWVLEPIDAVCKHLELSVAERGSCGYHRIARKCLLVDSFIGPRTCAECPRRE